MSFVMIFVVLILAGKAPVIHEEKAPDLVSCLQTVGDLLSRFEAQRLPGKMQASCTVIGPASEQQVEH